MDKARISLGRTVQVIDYKDSLKYDVSVESTWLPDEDDGHR